MDALARVWFGRSRPPASMRPAQPRSPDWAAAASSGCLAYRAAPGSSGWRALKEQHAALSDRPDPVGQI